MLYSKKFHLSNNCNIQVPIFFFKKKKNKNKKTKQGILCVFFQIYILQKKRQKSIPRSANMIEP